MNSRNMFSEPQDKEIKLNSLVSYLIRKWRLIVIIMLAFIIVGVLVVSYQIFVKMNDDEYMSAYKVRFDNALSNYTNKAEALDSEIELIQSNLIKLKAYYDGSLLMKIDPYQKMVTTSIYYIDSGFQIIPENTYQDIDYASRLIKMYLTYLTSGELYTQLMEYFPGVSDVQYIKELVSVSADYTTNMITISIINGDGNTGQIMDAINARMKEAYTEASDVIIEHKLSKISYSVYTIMDQNLAQQQQENFNHISTSSDQLQEKVKELDQLKQEGEPRWEYSPRSIAVRLIKNAVLTGALGLLAALFLLAVYYIASDRILDVDKLQSLPGVKALGVIPGDKPMRRKSSGNKRQTDSRENAISLTARSICATVMASGIGEGGIALAGSVGADELAAVAKSFNEAVPESKHPFVVAGDPVRDVSSVEAIEAAQIAVIVVKLGTSLCSDILGATDRIRAWGKPVLGAVFLEAD